MLPHKTILQKFLTLQTGEYKTEKYKTRLNPYLFVLGE